MTADLHLTELGSGGELVLLGEDLAMAEELLQIAYIALFGGNIEANTRGNEIPGEERQDWWANSLIYPQAPNKQFNSYTERVLGSIVLNSSGRLDIQRAVERDLEILSSIAEVTVNVSIQTYNRVEILIRLRKLSNKEEKQLQLIFDNARNEVIIEKEI